MHFLLIAELFLSKLAAGSVFHVDSFNNIDEDILSED